VVKQDTMGFVAWPVWSSGFSLPGASAA